MYLFSLVFWIMRCIPCFFCTEIRTSEKKESDLVFAVSQSDGMPDPQNLYYEIARFFGKTLDSMGKGSREDGSNERRREITFIHLGAL
jgi:hypothetical protein